MDYKTSAWRTVYFVIYIASLNWNNIQKESQIRLDRLDSERFAMLVVIDHEELKDLISYKVI